MVDYTDPNSGNRIFLIVLGAKILQNSDVTDEFSLFA